MRETVLDKKWDELMSRCKKETELKRDDVHPKLVRFLGNQIAKMAKELGFRDDQIRHREFRAEKSADHIIRLLTE